MASTASSWPSLDLQNTEEVKKIFDRFDANGDGLISATELANVLSALGTVTSEEEAQRMMEEMDTDRDGFVNLEEFAEFCGKKDSGDSELKDAFDKYDQDKNGLISAAELHLVLTRLGERCSVQDCGRMIQSFDSDGDGNINFDEFKKMMNK
ncbi:hypothetical protein Dimus_028519 [Dionaea muscipula]